MNNLNTSNKFAGMGGLNVSPKTAPQSAPVLKKSAPPSGPKPPKATPRAGGKGGCKK